MTLNISLHGSNRLLLTFYSIMIAHDIHKCTNLALQKLIAITTVFHKSYNKPLCPLKKTLYGSKCNRFKTFYFIMIANDIHNAQIIFMQLQKLIVITIVFRILCQCAIMSEITITSN